MPLNRYQIRNEYSLADPELYRAADKDDPEALLEGVAMAGLVGVLRQLGDLAEFAAEIFHDLHEEVMVTAARGHSLTARVQQLESEFPAIEKAFLSQTNHSAFFYNSGLDWHPNLRMEQSLITQGDLPRFVMDSYEECRGPPRLFLLDKFDVAGAGACLKRYSDPSFFRVEPSSFGVTGTDIQREKKARKSKKKGSRWRNGETPEALPTVHAKLHQLFLEERIQNGTSDPAHQVKLKRRLNGFPFTSKSGKSYMEKFLKSPSPDHKEVHEIPVDPVISEITKISKMSPEKELDPRPISLPSPPPANENITPGLFEDMLDEVPSDTRDSGMLQTKPDVESYSGSGIEAYNIPSNLLMEDSEKEIVVDDGSKTDDSIDDYQSDDIASEIDNYLDALTTMESEMDTDSEVKIRNDLHCLNSKREARGLDPTDVKLQAHSSDSQSVGNSTLSDDGNSMSKKEVSSFSCSDTHSVAAENTPLDGEVSCNIFSTTAETHETEIIDSSMNQKPINTEYIPSHPAGSALLDGLSTEAIESPSPSPETANQSHSPSDSDPSHRNREVFTKESTGMINEMDEEVTNPRVNIPSICEATEPRDYDSPETLPCENQLMDESEGGEKDTSENIPVQSFSSVSSHSKVDLQLHLLAENKIVDKINDENMNQDESVSSLTNQDLSDDDPSRINHEKLYLWSHDDHQPLEELHAEDLNENKSAPIATNLSDNTSPLRDDKPVAVSTEALPVEEVVDEYLSSSVDGLSDMAADRQSGENLGDGASKGGQGRDLAMLNLDDDQIGGQNLPMFLTEQQPFCQTYSSDAEHCDTVSKIDDINPSAGEADNLTPKEATLGELVEPLDSEIDTEVLSIRSLEEQTSSSKEVNLKEPFDTEDGAEKSEISCNTNMCERDPGAECVLLAGDHEELDERDTDSVNATPILSDSVRKAIVNDDGSSGDLKILQVSESGPVGEVKDLITGEACLCEGPAEPGATESLHQQILSLRGSNSDFAQLIDSSQLESDTEIPNNVSGTYLVLEAKDNVNGTMAVPSQSSFEQIEVEFSCTEGKVESLTDQIDQQHVSEADSEVINDPKLTQYEEQIDHVVPSDSSNSVPIKLPGEPSETEFSLQGSNGGEISEHLIYPSTSILSTLSPLPDASQIYEDEMPPMPPLPPVQWRMTKFQHATPVQERGSVLNNASSFPPLLPSKGQDTQPVNQLLPESVLGDNSSHPATQQFSSVVHHGDLKDSVLPLQETQYRGIIQFPGADGEIGQNSFQDYERENEKSRLDLSSNLSPADPLSSYVSEMPHESTRYLNQESQETSLNRKEFIPKISIVEENVLTSNKTALSSKTVVFPQPERGMPASSVASGLPNEKFTGPHKQETPETSTNKKELGSRPEPQEEIVVSSDNNSVSVETGNEQPQHTMSTSEATLALPVGEEYKPNGLRPTKIPRPRNPLIDAVAAHDKSKLRKVTERVRPQIPKVDERDSLLEQIRTKSFNLKPAVVTRPSIPGPTTNLKVAAILEKAKTIRQAFAGSDEDDDDNWSDS